MTLAPPTLRADGCPGENGKVKLVAGGESRLAAASQSEVQASERSVVTLNGVDNDRSGGCAGLVRWRTMSRAVHLLRFCPRRWRLRAGRAWFYAEERAAGRSRREAWAEARWWARVAPVLREVQKPRVRGR